MELPLSVAAIVLSMIATATAVLSYRESHKRARDTYAVAVSYYLSLITLASVINNPEVVRKDWDLGKTHSRVYKLSEELAASSRQLPREAVVIAAKVDCRLQIFHARAEGMFHARCSGMASISARRACSDARVRELANSN
jgi:hypothetical protein